jgi:hypothetical protein
MGGTVRPKMPKPITKVPSSTTQGPRRGKTTPRQEDKKLPVVNEFDEEVNTTDNTVKRRGKKLIVPEPTQGLGTSGGLL